MRSGEYAQITKTHVDAIAFDRTQSSVSGEIAGPLRACGGQADGVNDGKADTQCIAVSFRGREGGVSVECEEEISPSLRSAQGGSDKQFVAFGVSENQRSELRLTEYSRQISSGGGKPGQGYPCVAFANVSDGSGARNAGDLAQLLTGRHGDPGSVAGSFGVRRLMPIECERLQGFPDGWTAGQSDTARYKQLGNAVCVNVAEWIGKRIVKVR